MCRMAVGMKETRRATARTTSHEETSNIEHRTPNIERACAGVLILHSLNTLHKAGKNTIAQGRPSGRLLAFAPTIRAADSSDKNKSEDGELKIEDGRAATDH